MKLPWYLGAIAPFLISFTKGGPGVWKWVECSPALSLLAPLLMTNLMKVRICQVSDTKLFCTDMKRNKDISASTSLSTSTIDKPSLRMTKWRNILRNLNAINQILYRLRFYANWMFEEDITFESLSKSINAFCLCAGPKSYHAEQVQWTGLTQEKEGNLLDFRSDETYWGAKRPPSTPTVRDFSALFCLLCHREGVAAVWAACQPAICQNSLIVELQAACWQSWQKETRIKHL